MQTATFWILTGAKNDGGGGDNWNYKTRKAPKAPVKSSPQTY